VTPSARCAAFTLLEVLVAAALTVLVGFMVATNLHGTRVGEGGLETSATDRLAVDVGAAVLATELRRAGYRPADGPGDPWSAPPREIVLRPAGMHGDAIEIRSLDDRVGGTAVARDWRFDVAVDGRGEPQLYRQAGQGSRQPLVQGVDRLTVVGYIGPSGPARVETALGASVKPSALTLRVRSRSGRERSVVVPLPSRPEMRVAVEP